MTAVLSPTDALRRDPIMASLDDNQFKYSYPCHTQSSFLTIFPNSYSSTDWKAKYNEVADMLAETRAELDEFHTSSKELEEELIKEIDRTEKAQQDLKVKVAKTELDRDEWKVFLHTYSYPSSLINPSQSPNLYRYRPRTTQPPPPCSESWIHSDRSLRN